MTHNKVRPNEEGQRKADIHQNTTKGVMLTGTKEAISNTKVTTAVLITVRVILLILTLTSIALSVATFTQLTSMQSKMMASQLNNQNEDKSCELNSTQLIQTQNNISQTLTQLDDRVNDFILTHPQSQSQCGAGLWWRVAYPNMTEPSQQCPSAWREYQIGEVRACRRPVNSPGSCVAKFYCTNRQYSRVCGRIIGYQVASPDAFKNSGGNPDGVIISHGAQQNHVWSFVAGLTERSQQYYRQNNCPCSPEAGTHSPMNIGDNYFCESGNPNDGFERGHLYSSDRLWDGQQCEGSCCEGTQSTPWFSVQLPAPTTDMIEVRICCDQGTLDEAN